MGLVPLAASAQWVERGPESALPVQVPATAYQDAPPPWRDYFLAVSKAERIIDPLERCLAYPALPGNRWPEGHERAHCLNHYQLQIVPKAELGEMVSQGRFDALDQRLAISLARHFEADAHEDIHYTFDQISADPADDVLTAAWLKGAKESPYAALARSKYLAAVAWETRGGATVAQTDPAQMEKALQLAAESIRLAIAAAKIEPRLMPAYETILAVGQLGGQNDARSWAIQQARQYDPYCLSMVRAVAFALQPRWGGSYLSMTQFTESLAAVHRQRPLVAMYEGAVAADQASWLEVDDKVKADLAEAAVMPGSNEHWLSRAAELQLDLPRDVRDSWKAHGMLLQAERFQPTDGWSQRQLAWFLMERDPPLALRLALRAVASDPDSGYGHYQLARAYALAARFEEAGDQYLEASADPELGQGALSDAAMMWLYRSGAEPKAAAVAARPFIQRLLEQHPDDGRGWMLDLEATMRITSRLTSAQIDRTLAKLDRADPQQADYANHLESLRGSLDQVRPMQIPPQTQ